MRLMTYAISAVAATLLVSTAQAADITLKYDITASGFGPGAPVDPVIEIVIVTFDPTKSDAPTTQGFTIDSFNLPYSTEFSYDQPDDIVTFGTDLSEPGEFQLNPATYGTFIYGATTATPNSDVYEYSYSDEAYAASSIAITSETVSSAPEPSTWALMLAGIGGIGVALRQSKKSRPALSSLPA